MPEAKEAEQTLRDGRYVLTRKLGEGSQGATFEAVDKREGRLVAIKRFDVRGARSWKDVELAEREAKVLASLSHPLLPKYLEHFEEGSVLYLVMEKIEGETLQSIRKRGAMREEDVLALLRDAATVLDHLHGRAPPVIHRDLKPGNVLRRPDGRFAFVDFGAVRDRLRPEGGSTVVGTFGYMAPEQFQGRAVPATDIYSLGATAIAMLTGEEPETLPHKGLGIDVAAALGRRASPAMVRVLSAMLDPDPDRRAPRLGPLVQQLERERREGRAPESRESKHDTRHDTRESRHDKRRESRDERKARRRAHEEERKERRERAREEWKRRRDEWRRGHGWRPPLIFRIVASLALLVAALAVTMALRVVVPMVLTILSLFFGRGLQRAADRVGLAGERAVKAISEARQWAVGAESPPPPEGVRVVQVSEQERGARLRVEDHPPSSAWDDEEEIEAEEKRRENEK
jgi:hypothetical protein